MSVKLRMQRRGARHAPYYRIVAADTRSPRDGRYVELLGVYNPRSKEPQDELRLNLERIDHWLRVGALPSDSVRSMIKRARRGPIPSTDAEHADSTGSRQADSAAESVKEAVHEAEEVVSTSSVGEAAVSETAPQAEEASAEETPTESASREDGVSEEASAVQEEAIQEEAVAEEAPADSAGSPQVAEAEKEEIVSADTAEETGAESVEGGASEEEEEDLEKPAS